MKQCFVVRRCKVYMSPAHCSDVYSSKVMCSTVMCSTVYCSTVQCSTVQCSVAQYSVAQHSTFASSAMQCSGLCGVMVSSCSPAPWGQANRSHSLRWYWSGSLAPWLLAQCPWHLVALAPWHLGSLPNAPSTLSPWYLGTLAPWHLGNSGPGQPFSLADLVYGYFAKLWS